MKDDVNNDIFLRLDKMLHKVEGIDEKMNWIIIGQSEGKTINQIITDFFKKNKRTAQVYLEVDGIKSNLEIAKKLNVTSGAISQHFTKLLKNGFIEETKKYGVFKKQRMERILHIEKIIKRNVLK